MVPVPRRSYAQRGLGTIWRVARDFLETRRHPRRETLSFNNVSGDLQNNLQCSPDNLEHSPDSVYHTIESLETIWRVLETLCETQRDPRGVTL